MTMHLSTATVAKITDATVRMVDHWARTGLLRPSGQDATGKGSRRRYTFQDAIVLQAIRNLRRGGCPLQTIRKVVRHLLTHYPGEAPTPALTKLTLLTDGKSVHMLTDGQQVLDVVSGQFKIGWLVPLGKLILETRERLDAIPEAWTERAIIEGREYHLDISQSVTAGSGYIARCRELPGALQQGATAEAAVAALKRAVHIVLAHALVDHSTRKRAVRTFVSG